MRNLLPLVLVHLTGFTTLPAPEGEARVRVSDVTLPGDMECFRVETPAATYIYGKRGAGFASLLDADGHDWVAYHTGDLAKGEYRGLPKCGQPTKFFHCGYGYGLYKTENAFTSRVTVREPDHIRIESESRDGKSACAWDFYSTHATLTLQRIDLPTYWFLYEGVPGGKLDPEKDFVIRPDGTKTPLDTPWSQVVPWVCFGAAESKFGFVCIHHQEPEERETDSYTPWPFQKEKDGSFQDMTVFGFGRKGYKELVEHIPDLRQLPARFSIGFVATADHATAKAACEAILKQAPPSAPVSASKTITAPLRALATNPHYFTDGSGKAIYLTGSHTWNDFQDWGTNDSIRLFDFGAYVDMLVAHHHNMTLLWTTELPTFRGLPSTESMPPDFSVTPHPWQRTGPGNASDGKPKFDLTKFHPAYFDRLEDRVRRLQEAGIYAGVYLFSGEFLLRFRFAGDGYPFTGGNNVNGIDDGGGVGAVTMKAPNAITSVQDAYVRKVIDTLNHFPNVLWIVSQEAPAGSVWWNSHVIALIRSYEATLPMQHPIGYGVLEDGQDATIISSDADWIAPAVRISPVATCGTGRPACKVNINDSDHSYFGIWNDSPQVNRNYFWLNFTNGNQTLFMDPYVVYYPRERRNLCPSPVNGIGTGPDPRWDAVRDTMGHIREYAERMDLAATTPQPGRSSTGHALAQKSARSAEILVYEPSGGRFTVDLSDLNGPFAVEWMQPATGVKTRGEDVSGGGARTFVPPFGGDAVLYLSFPSVK
jgi:hypothetical protein